MDGATPHAAMQQLSLNECSFCAIAKNLSSIFGLTGPMAGIAATPEWTSIVVLRETWPEIREPAARPAPRADHKPSSSI